MKINLIPKNGENAFMKREIPVARQEVKARKKHAKIFEEL
jgi:hypothetical protein